MFEGLGTVVIMNLVEEKLSNFSNHHQILLHVRFRFAFCLTNEYYMADNLYSSQYCHWYVGA